MTQSGSADAVHAKSGIPHQQSSTTSNSTMSTDLKGRVEHSGDCTPVLLGDGGGASNELFVVCVRNNTCRIRTQWVVCARHGLPQGLATASRESDTRRHCLRLRSLRGDCRKELGVTFGSTRLPALLPGRPRRQGQCAFRLLLTRLFDSLNLPRN